MMTMALQVLVCTSWLLLLQSGGQGDREAFIGWQGETYQAGTPTAAASSTQARSKWIETLSWSPRAFLYHNFLEPHECAHLRSMAEPRLSRSMVLDGKGREAEDPVRTSHSASFSASEDPVLEGIAKRIANWTHLPQDMAEPFEILRYTGGQKYDSHWDWFDVADMKTSQRVATVLMYLSEVAQGGGGETALPLAEPLDGEQVVAEGLSPCAARSSLAVRPKLGSALLFWDAHPNYTTVDRAALHASCPTTQDVKWTCTCWIHGTALT